MKDTHLQIQSPLVFQLKMTIVRENRTEPYMQTKKFEVRACSQIHFEQ